MQNWRFLILLLIAVQLSGLREASAQWPGGPSPAQPPALRRLLVIDSTLDTAHSIDPPLVAEESAGANHVLHMTSLDDRAWRKGKFRIKPYGFFLVDTIYSSQRTEAGAYTAFVFSPEEQGEGEFIVDARQSRFGLQILGPKIPSLADAESGGRIKIDFFRNFVTENGIPHGPAAATRLRGGT